MDTENRHLKQKRGYWHYQRRVPKRYASFDDRRVVECSLRTKSIEIARLRRDAMEESDNLFWASIAGIDGETETPELVIRQRAVAQRRYKAAATRALARGFVYTPAAELAETAGVEELVERLKTVETVDESRKRTAQDAEVEAVLGGLTPPAVTVSEAFEVYCNEIASLQLVNKSADQKARWKKTKRRGVQYFIDVVGDKPMREITRQDARQFYNWWRERCEPKPGKKALSPNTASRDLGNMRQLYSEYFTFIGEEARQNPFRNLSFETRKTGLSAVPPFEDEWVRTRILVPGAFEGMNDDAVRVVYALIETGCRPSEIANLLADDIFLDAEVPFIRIQPRRNREIKTNSSIRDIPLVGVSLEAMRKSPDGFPRFRDKPDLLSNTLLQGFRRRKLFPTKKHVIYSFRHSFEKRMLEAGIDNDLRMLLMGHANSRPAYGDGGSMSFRRDELLKIAHPFTDILSATV